MPYNLDGVNILCLASGRGQQGPLLAATGVMLLDISENQLDQDRIVAKREGLNLKTVRGNKCDLSMFSDEEFDVVFCPSVCNLYL